MRAILMTILAYSCLPAGNEGCAPSWSKGRVSGGLESGTRRSCRKRTNETRASFLEMLDTHRSKYEMGGCYRRDEERGHVGRQGIASTRASCAVDGMSQLNGRRTSHGSTSCAVNGMSQLNGRRTSHGSTSCAVDGMSQLNGRRTSHGSTSGVYVLELEGGYVYVGKSGNIQLRMKQHMMGVGSVFTRAHKPTGWFLGRIGNVCGDGDGPERDETLRQMHRKGVHMVRGWKYVGMYLTPSELKDIESNTRELLDLCRICGGEGHFASGCAMRTC